jgi:hypothetical protein
MAENGNGNGEASIITPAGSVKFCIIGHRHDHEHVSHLLAADVAAEHLRRFADRSDLLGASPCDDALQIRGPLAQRTALLV